MLFSLPPSFSKPFVLDHLRSATSPVPCTWNQQGLAMSSIVCCSGKACNAGGATVEHTLELTGQSNAGLVLEGTGSHQLQQPLESCRSKGPVAPPSLVAPATARPEQGHVPAHESPPPGSWGRTSTDCSVRSLTELSLQPAVALAVAQICKAT